MTLQSSGAITLAQIQAEFGGSNPASLSEYYRGGSYVPNTTTNSSIPTSGTITMSNFYSGSNAAPAWSMGNFSSQSNKTRNSYYYSNTLTASSTGTVSVSAGGTSSYKKFKVNGGGLVTSASIANGNTLRMRIRASGSYSSTVTGTIAGNGNTSSFSVTTGGAPSPPPPSPPPPTSSCLAASMPIFIQGASVEETIGDLVAGDQVTSFNSPTIIDETNPNWESWSEDDISDGSNVVTSVIRADAFLVGRYIRINGQVDCTEPHPLLVQRSNLWQWIRASALVVGDNLYGIDASAIPITSLETIDGQLQVVDVGAETVDTYFAGKIDGVYILNHNK